VNEAQHNAKSSHGVSTRAGHGAPHRAECTSAFAVGRGYRTKVRAGDPRRSNPLFHRERGGSERIFTFIDLVEILFVKTFIDRGVSMRTIRLVQSEARRSSRSVTLLRQEVRNGR